MYPANNLCKIDKNFEKLKLNHASYVMLDQRAMTNEIFHQNHSYLNRQIKLARFSKFKSTKSN